jgi:hypothetical protein
MIRSVFDRFGVGMLAAVGLTLLALSVVGVAGLADRIDAATPPVTPVRSLDVRHDCHGDGTHPQRRRQNRREAPAGAPAREV